LLALASLDGSGEAVSPAARERFVADAREGDDGDGSLWSLGRFLLVLPPPSFFLLLLLPPPSPTAEGGASPERARDKTGRMGRGEGKRNCQFVFFPTSRRGGKK
jgi:hypothetical protein